MYVEKNEQMFTKEGDSQNCSLLLLLKAQIETDMATLTYLICVFSNRHYFFSGVAKISNHDKKQRW